MKRVFIVLGICCLLGVCPAQLLHAATIAPTQSALAAPTPVDAGALNEIIDNSEPFSIGGTASSTNISIKNVNLTAGSDFQVPKLEDVANFFASGAAYLIHNDIKQQSINQEQNLYISGRATYYKTNANNQPISVNSDNAYTTEIIPELSTLDQASRFAAAITSRYSIAPVGGVYDYNYNRGPLILAPQTIDELSGSGETQEAKLVKTIGSFFENRGGLLEILKSIFGTSGVIKAVLASKQLTPYSESMDCLITGCSANGDLTYLTPEEQEKVKENGGIVKTYASVFHKITTGDPNGQEENNFDGVPIKTNSLGTKAIENATNYMKCSILPMSAQEKFGLTDKCKPETVTPIASESCDETFKGVTLTPEKYSGFGSSNDGTLGFSIPMHNTKCTISNVEAVADFAAQWIQGRPEAAQAKANVLEYYQTIEEWSIKMGWNPSYLVALWIEETAAGAIGGQPMGCTFDVAKGVGVGTNSTVCEQLLCIYDYPVRNSTYDLLCSYAASGVGCTTFALDYGKNDNRCFPSNVRGSYQEVVARGQVSSSGCFPKGRTSKLFVDDCKAKNPAGSPFD